MSQQPTSVTRRRFLLLTGAGAVGGALAACDTAPSGGGGPDSADDGGASTGPITWWDHFNPLRDLHGEMFAAFEADTGIAVEFTPQQTGEMGEALRLAKQSDQLPDVLTNVGLQLPVPALIAENWFQPITLNDEALAALPPEALADGVHRFGGELYTFPIFNFRQYWAATWYNRALAEQAGLDPDAPPATYDEFRAAARAVSDAGGDDVFGWMLALGQPPRLAEQINFLAQAGGFEGSGGVLFKTGEFAFHDDAYVNAIEFWLSLRDDGLLVPGTEPYNDRDARARWAAGQAGYYFDGPWCAGVVMQDLADFAEQMDVGPMLVPEAGMDVVAYRGPQGGAFFLSGPSQRQADVGELLSRFTSPAYYQGLAENMDQPPLDLAVVAQADVHPAYAKLIGWYQEQVYLAPLAVAQNPDIDLVNTEMPAIEPDLGMTIQGLFAGELGDVRTALQALSDRSMAAREEAIAAATANGAQVDMDSWAFPDWQPRQDFTPDMYG
ncbi:ABC transporter substrate-binding protein [Pseudactinotalea terrae]|uniref:ABC transporter substrate-binding protein n=1 Tax=Pseudactinotalea terrae TaxID=1743262 RepID=UPI0012E2E4B9|nr:extracellular solute-binding protein [Pseudactinotalea terrae]